VVKKIASDGKKCVETGNEATSYFYQQLIRMADGLNKGLPGSKFVVVNLHKIITDIIKNPSKTGICIHLYLYVGVKVIKYYFVKVIDSDIYPPNQHFSFDNSVFFLKKKDVPPSEP